MATSESNLGKYDGMDEAALDAHIRLRVEAEVSAYKKALGKYEGMDEAALDAHIRLHVEAEVSAYKKALADEKLAKRIEERARARDAARNVFHKLIHGGDDEQA